MPIKTIKETRTDKLKEEACILEGFTGGQLELIISINRHKLDVSYSLGGRVNECFKNARTNTVFMQGFFGITSANRKDKTNDIDIKMIEFFNLNPQFYKKSDETAPTDPYIITKVNETDLEEAPKKQKNEKRKTKDIKKEAIDVIEAKRLREES